MTTPVPAWANYTVKGGMLNGLMPEELDLQICLHCRTVYAVLIGDPRTLCSVCALTAAIEVLMALAKGILK